MSTTPPRRERVDALRFHGITYRPDRTRDVAFPGGKFNLPDVNARIGVAQLAQLPSFLATRRALVARYFERFATDPPCVLPPRPRDGDGQSWNMFSVLLPLAEMAISRQEFRAALDARRHRHRRIVRGAPLEHARSPLRVQGRRLSGHRADRARNGDAAAARGDDGRRRGSRLRRGRRGDRRVASLTGIEATEENHDGDAEPLGRDSRLQRGSEPADALRAALSGARRARHELRGHLRQRRQPRPLGGAPARAVGTAPRCDARRAVQRQLRPASGDRRRLRALPRRARRHDGRRPAESARGDRQAAGGDGRGPRLRRRRAARPRGLVVPAATHRAR